MINTIIAAISISLNREFGDGYEIMMEENHQDLQEPCFFISCLNPSIRLFLGKRYYRQNQFCIQYFPKTEDINEECNLVAERMLWCLEEIVAEGDVMRGTGMRYEVVDGVLNFFVNYDCFVYKKTVEESSMESIEAGQEVKG